MSSTCHAAKYRAFKYDHVRLANTGKLTHACCCLDMKRSIDPSPDVIPISYHTQRGLSTIYFEIPNSLRIYPHTSNNTYTSQTAVLSAYSQSCTQCRSPLSPLPGSRSGSLTFLILPIEQGSGQCRKLLPLPGSRRSRVSWMVMRRTRLILVRLSRLFSRDRNAAATGERWQFQPHLLASLPRVVGSLLARPE